MLLFSADFTLVNFYFTYVDTSATNNIGYLSPNDLMTPDDAALETALIAAGFDNMDVQAAPVFKNIQNSFGLFIDGTVYEEDIDAFLVELQAFWRTEQALGETNKYTEVLCVNGFVEKYFTSIET